MRPLQYYGIIFGLGQDQGSPVILIKHILTNNLGLPVTRTPILTFKTYDIIMIWCGGGGGGNFYLTIPLFTVAFQEVSFLIDHSAFSLMSHHLRYYRG